VIPVEYHEAAEGELLNEIGYLELRSGGLGDDAGNEGEGNAL